MNLVRANAVEGSVTHYHESLMSESKIFFDIDIKIPQAVFTNPAILDYCHSQLGYSDDVLTSNEYAYLHKRQFGSVVEQFIVYIAQDAVVSVY